jgi:hypothetical protein
MKDSLTFSQIKELKDKMQKGTFVLGHEIFLLVDLGFERSKAEELLSKVMKSHKEDLFYKIKEEREIEEKGNIAFVVIVMFSSFVSILGNNSGFLIFLSIIAACFAGFLGFPNKPIAGLMGCVIGAILMPILTGYYLKGRDSFFSIELLIPIIFSFGPGFLVKMLVSKLMYSEED